jgi:SNF2 family DNA or RNA helicase
MGSEIEPRALSIVIKDGFIIVQGAIELLSPIHQSQLRFWHFSFSTATRSWSCLKHESTGIPTLVAYLTKNEIPLDLSTEIQAELEYHDLRRISLGTKFEAARMFKDATAATPEYREFKNILRGRIKLRLKEHQIKAIYHAYLLGRAANFSVPGSGKTAVIISLYEMLRAEGKVDFLFVVGPPSSFGPWQFEFNQTLGRRPVTVVLPGNAKSFRAGEYATRIRSDVELYLTTFSTLLNDQAGVESFFQLNGSKPFLIVDEAHYIKRLDGNWAGATLRVAKQCEFKAILTGTPMPREYSDLFNLFDFLWDSESPLDARTKLDVLGKEAQGAEDVAGEIIREKIGGLFYRVRKVDLGLLPQNFEPPYLLKLKPIESEIYSFIQKKIADISEEDYKQNYESLTALKKARIMRLRQATSFIPMLQKAIAGCEEDLVTDERLAQMINNYLNLETPAKAEQVMSLTRGLVSKGEKVLIWTNFTATLKFLLGLLSEAGLYSKAIFGETPFESKSMSIVDSREAIREEFVAGGLQVLVANPAACAESISLHTSCHHAIYYDLSYNCAQYLQSLDRIHRIGGSETQIANYHFPLYEGTLEQDILSSLKAKAARMERLIDMDFSVYSLNMDEDDNSDVEAYDRLFQRSK